MIEVNSKEEAIEWATRCPASDNEIIEIRQIQEITDSPPMSKRPQQDLPTYGIIRKSGPKSNADVRA